MDKQTLLKIPDSEYVYVSPLMFFAELLAGRKLWQTLPDPFPAWESA